MMKNTKLLQDIGKLAQAKGMKAYLVGGPVRDLLLGHPGVDVDITVEGDGMVLARAFAAAHNAKVTCYPAFKTASVTLPGAQGVDFATARKERYARPGALPAVTPSDIHDDLLRRDFTINAMAMSLQRASWQEMVDPFGGQADLKAGKVRILHDKSFVDDPTRILRAARFKERFGFSMEAGTMKLLKAAVAGGALETIRPQRYVKELNKILKEDNPQAALACLKSWGALKQIGEEIYGPH